MKPMDKLDENKIRELSPVALAYIGDTIYDLYVRTALVSRRAGRIEEMHKAASGVVNARAQAQAALMLEGSFTQREAEIFRAGRNAKSTPPKNMTRADYSLATGLEAVIGYLYLTGQEARTEALLYAVIDHFLGGNSHA
jgi:ribonuclease III family protein